ncbi:unnamed protein product [Peronospora belbahrii]|uniref:PDZ domain-containing protein n=1 Tax=Peronospora belbahrii TaxID=622444 RepID=A0AAU9KHS3_9STRA|nr:unnamed protein product [Peronospora belbahrii]CAH0517618.1 unnamed protein product [Peronospora belbahrii]
MADAIDALQMTQMGVDVRLDERKMYVVEWTEGVVFGFTVTPVQSDRGVVLCLTRRTTSSGLQDVMPGDILIAIGEDKVYRLGLNKATKLLRSVPRPVRLTLQVSPDGPLIQDDLPDLAPNEYTYLWNLGPLGIVLKTDPKSKLPVVKRFTGKADSTALEGSVKVGDELVYVNQTPTCNHSISDIISFIKELPKPITLRFRKPLVEELPTQRIELGEGEYDFLWENGPLGLVIGTSANGLPYVRSFTGKGTSKYLAQVHESDEIILVNDRSAKEHGFHATMQYLMHVSKPAVIRFRRPFTNKSKNGTPSKPVASSSPLTAHMAAINIAANPSQPNRASSPAMSAGRASSPAFVQSYSSLPRSTSVVSEKEAGLLGYRGTRNNRSFTLSQSQRMSRHQAQQPQSLQVGEDLTSGQNALGQSYGYNGHQSQLQQQQSYQQQQPPLSPYQQEPLQQQQDSSHQSPPQQFYQQWSSQQSYPHYQTAVTQRNEDFFDIDSNAYYQIQWTDGPFGFTVREAQSKQGSVVLITKRTGKSTCAGLRRVAVGDILITIGDKDVRQLGFERSTIHLRNVPKPALLTFQAID